MSKLGNKILDSKSPENLTKRQLKKLAYKRMGGDTARERFSNFFTNRNGYYSWKEMCTNYIIIICLVLLLAATIACIVMRKTITIKTLTTNPYMYSLLFTISILLIVLFIKIRQRKQRYKCFINDGISTKYVFWKDDKTNPKNYRERNHF